MQSMNYENLDTISVDTTAILNEEIEKRERELFDLKSLGGKVNCIHSNMLYYRDTKSKKGSVCYDSWKVLVKKIGGTQNCWRDLGQALHLPKGDLDYIQSSVQNDKADTVIKVFSQNEEATLDKIVTAFIELQRFDIIKEIYEPFCELTNCLVNNGNDSGYQSNSISNGYKSVIKLAKDNFDLPPALLKNMQIRDKDPNKPSPVKNKSPSQKSDTNNKSSSILFLTFTEDGQETANHIKEYVSSWTEFDPVSVVTLNDLKDEVRPNPEKTIRGYFEQAEFVVPIITPGYLNEIQSHNASSANTSNNLDYKYVNFIYSLIVNHYIHATGCLNKKVRTVLPQAVDVNVLHQISMYPDLMPATHESLFNEQFKAFLNCNKQM